MPQNQEPKCTQANAKLLTRKWSTKTLKCKLFPQVQSKTDWCKGRYDWKRILDLVRLKVRLLVIGCRHSSVDLSALSILPPQLRLPSTPATLLSFIVDFVLYLSLKCDKRTKINKKRPGFGTFFEKILHIIWPIKVCFYPSVDMPSHWQPSHKHLLT